jgi:hypothetical protein
MGCSQSHTSPSNVQIHYENSRSVESDRAQRVKCLEIAANVSNTGDADHISDLARRFWSFVREGE